MPQDFICSFSSIPSGRGAIALGQKRKPWKRQLNANLKVQEASIADLPKIANIDRRSRQVCFIRRYVSTIQRGRPYHRRHHRPFPNQHSADC